MAQNEKTSRELAKLAAKVLADGRSGKTARRLAGSVLTQTPDRIKKAARAEEKKRRS